MNLRKSVLPDRVVTLSLVVGISAVLGCLSPMKASTSRTQISLTSRQTQEALRAAGISPRILRLVITRGLNMKIRPTIASRCMCPGMPQDAGPFGDCFGSCLQRAGVSPIQVVMCGASCALAETGVGLILCALCVGLNVTALEVCFLYCSTHRVGDGGKGPGELLGRNSTGTDRGLRRVLVRTSPKHGNASRTLRGT